MSTFSSNLIQDFMEISGGGTLHLVKTGQKHLALSMTSAGSVATSAITTPYERSATAMVSCCYDMRVGTNITRTRHNVTLQARCHYSPVHSLAHADADGQEPRWTFSSNRRNSNNQASTFGRQAVRCTANQRNLKMCTF